MTEPKYPFAKAVFLLCQAMAEDWNFNKRWYQRKRRPDDFIPLAQSAASALLISSQGRDLVWSYIVEGRGFQASRSRPHICLFAGFNSKIHRCAACENSRV